MEAPPVVVEDVQPTPVVMQRTVPTVDAVQKTVEVPQIQHIENIVNVPVVSQRQALTIQTDTVDVPRNQFLHRVVDVAVVTQQRDVPVPCVMTPEVVRQLSDVPAVPRAQLLDRVDDVPVSRQRQTPMIQIVQKTVEVPQIQFIDKFVDSPESVQADLEIELEVSTPEHRTHDDENKCVTASTEGMEQDACVHAVAPASSRAQREFDNTEAGVECVGEDLKEMKKMLEFLVRRERKVDVKTEVAVKKLERLEKERDEQDDKEREASLKEALADKTRVVKLVVDKWFVEKGFGCGKVPTDEIVFIHASVVHGGEVLMIGTDAWVQVVNDEARVGRGDRARNASGRKAWKEEKDREKANRVAQQVRRAAALTAELAGSVTRES